MSTCASLTGRVTNFAGDISDSGTKSEPGIAPQFIDSSYLVSHASHDIPLTQSFRTGGNHLFKIVFKRYIWA
jgi:hypothetical protein